MASKSVAITDLIQLPGDIRGFPVFRDSLPSEWKTIEARLFASWGVGVI